MDGQRRKMRIKMKGFSFRGGRKGCGLMLKGFRDKLRGGVTMRGGEN
jgi:hypothetical protein